MSTDPRARYQRWFTDSNGNLSTTAPAFASSTALEAYELGLHQDLNNDGLIGVPTPAFNIDVSYSGDSAYQSIFMQAAQRWQQVITGDLPGFNVPRSRIRRRPAYHGVRP